MQSELSKLHERGKNDTTGSKQRDCGVTACNMVETNLSCIPFTSGSFVFLLVGQFIQAWYYTVNYSKMDDITKLATWNNK